MLRIIAVAGVSLAVLVHGGTGFAATGPKLTPGRIEMQLAPRSQILRTITMVFNESGKIPIVEKSKDQLLDELASGSKSGLSAEQFLDALIPLLVDKGVISHRELERKARELAARKK